MKRSAATKSTTTAKHLPCKSLQSEYVKASRTVLLTQYCAGGKIETNEMGRACSAYGGG